MQVIGCHNGELQVLAQGELADRRGKGFATGLETLDGLVAGGRLGYGAVHEVLSEEGRPFFFSLLLAKSSIFGQKPGEKDPSNTPETPLEAGGNGWGSPLKTPCGGKLQITSTRGKSEIRNSKSETNPKHEIQNSKQGSSEGGAGARGVVVWSDPGGELYPPGVVGMGVPLERLWVLRPRSREEEVWAVAECLRCRGVRAVVAGIDRLSRVEARRLQLAAEVGGGVGILMRRMGKESGVYAAATRWLVRPMPGERLLQRWKVQLIHGHGGRVGQSVILEACRETNHVRVVETVGGGSVEEKVRRRA